MATISQYRPTYFAGHENKEVSFATIEDLLAIPFVAGFASIEKFHRFSLWMPAPGRSFNGAAQAHLMAEFDGGRRWFVVGRIEGEPPDLPNWQPVSPRIE